MATLLSLPNELIFAICSNLRNPSDILHLILVSSRFHRLTTNLLYQKITLDHMEGYASIRERSAGYGYPHTPIMRLISALMDRTICSTVHTLELILESNTRIQDFELRQLLPRMPNLQHLHLTACMGNPYFSVKMLSPSSMASALWPVRETLKTLYLRADQDRAYRDGSSIGSLRSFTALEGLSIQSHVLYGDEMHSLERADLRALLPPNLRKLYVDCLVDDVDFNADEILVCTQRGDLVCFGLNLLLAGDLNSLSKLRTVTVLLPESMPSQRDPKVQALAGQLGKFGAQASQRGIDIRVQFPMWPEDPFEF